MKEQINLKKLEQIVDRMTSKEALIQRVMEIQTRGHFEFNEKERTEIWLMFRETMEELYLYCYGEKFVDQY